MTDKLLDEPFLAKCNDLYSITKKFVAFGLFVVFWIKMHRGVVFWTTSTMKDEKSAAKFHYIKTVSGKIVEHSIAFRVLSIYC